MRRIVTLTLAALMTVSTLMPTSTVRAEQTAPSKDEVKSWTEGAYGVFQPQLNMHKTDGKFADEYFVWAPFPSSGSSDVPTASIVIPPDYPNADWQMITADNKISYGRGANGLTGFKWVFIRLNLAGAPAEFNPAVLNRDQVLSFAPHTGRIDNAPYFFVWPGPENPKGVDVTIPDLVSAPNLRYYWFGTDRAIHYGEGAGTMTGMNWAILIPS